MRTFIIEYATTKSKRIRTKTVKADHYSVSMETGVLFFSIGGGDKHIMAFAPGVWLNVTEIALVAESSVAA